MQNLYNISNKNNNKNATFQPKSTLVNKEDILDMDLSMKCPTNES